MAKFSAAVFLISVGMAMAMAQSSFPAQTEYPDAPEVKSAAVNAKSSPRPKTQTEYDAYKLAASLTDPAKLESAATEFAQRFPQSELRSILFQQAMGLYQQAQNPAKTLEMARAALKYDPNNSVALVAAAQVLAERTHDSDLDRDDRLAEAKADAQRALQTAGDIPPPTNMTQVQFASAVAKLRGTAHEVLATVAFKKQDYQTAIKEYEVATSVNKEHTDAVVWLRLSVAHDKSGDYTAAEAVVKKAIAASQPDSPVRQLAEQEESHLAKVASEAAKSSGK